MSHECGVGVTTQSLTEKVNLPVSFEGYMENSNQKPSKMSFELNNY